MFWNSEYKKVLSQLRYDESDFEMIGGYKFIKEEIVSLIKENKREINTMITEKKQKEQEILYNYMKKLIKEMICSGDFVNQDSKLGPKGQSLVNLYDLVCSKITGMHQDFGDLSGDKIKQKQNEGRRLLRLEMKKHGIKNVPDPKYW